MNDISASPNNTHLLPRLYIEESLGVGGVVPLSDESAHYLRHVLRQEDGALLRLFNAAQGEFLGRLDYVGKRAAQARIFSVLRAPEKTFRRVHALFSPLKKDKMDFLIEKAVELGVTDLHPLVFQRSIVRDVKEERLHAQIINAAEQCERLDIPVLHHLTPLTQLLRNWEMSVSILAAMERRDFPSLIQESSKIDDSIAYLVGPEGGLTDEEMTQLLNIKSVRPVSLGPRILRAETAVLFGLSIINQ
ncbi:MAG: RsmE family RNA methyltransferase [Pseudomonadota bacterium]